MERNLLVDKLLDKDVSTAECLCGACHGLVSSIEDVDYARYHWSGVIVGGRAIFAPTNFGDPMTDAERLEEANRKGLQATLELWYGQQSSL
jgi:hypothetical protein